MDCYHSIVGPMVSYHRKPLENHCIQCNGRRTVKPLKNHMPSIPYEYLLGRWWLQCICTKRLVFVRWMGIFLEHFLIHKGLNFEFVFDGPTCSSPKNLYLNISSVKKCRISGTKWATAARPRPALCQGEHKNVDYWVSSHDNTKKNHFRKIMDLGPKNCIFGLKFCNFLRYTCETTIFSSQTDPAL